MHVRDKRRVALAKADKHPALAMNILDRKPCAASIMPAGTDYRLEPGAGADLADPLEVVPECLRLDSPLPGIADMLQRATTTPTENGATCLDALRRRLEHVKQLGLVEITARFAALKSHLFTGQGTRDKDLLAADRSDAATIMRN